MEEEEARKLAAQHSAKSSSNKKKKKKKAGEASNGGAGAEVFGDGAGQDLEVNPYPACSPQESLSSAMQRVAIDPPEEELTTKNKQQVTPVLEVGNSWGENQWDADATGWQDSEVQNAPPPRSEDPGWEVAATRRGRKGKAPTFAGNAGAAASGGRRSDAPNGKGGLAGGRSSGQGTRGGKQGNNGGHKGNGLGRGAPRDGDWGAHPGRSVRPEVGRNLKLDGWGNPIPEPDIPRPPPLSRGGGHVKSQQHERSTAGAWQLEPPVQPPPPTGWTLDPEPGPLPVGSSKPLLRYTKNESRGGSSGDKNSNSVSSSRYQSSRSIESSAPSSATGGADEYPVSVFSDSQCSDDDFNDDSDYVSGDSDSEDDVFQTTHKWFQPFFSALKSLTPEQMTEHDRQWHCPACRGGVGAIDWYRGLQPLLTHSQTIRAKRVKLHRKFAKRLEEELRVRGAGTSSTVAGKFGKWKGLRDTDDSVNPLVLWPPMVVVQNTQLELDEQDKWIGMGNPELLDHFKEYNPLKARHAYGPQGHRGMSIVLFADSPAGYYDAQRLDRAFREARRSRDDWYRQSKAIFEPGGQRILYGYMATKEDIELFNRHGRGKMLVKCEWKRLNEAVLQPMRKQDEEYQQVSWLRDKVQKAQEHSKELEKTVYVITRKLRLREEEIKEIQRRALEQDEKNRREMDDLEKFYQDKVEQYEVGRSAQEQEEQKLREAYDKNIQRCQQLESQASQLDGATHQQQQRKLEAEIARQSQMVEVGLKNAEAYEARKNEIQQQHHLRKLAMKQQQYEQTLALEQQILNERDQILDEYKTESMKILRQFGHRDGVV